MKEKEFPPLTWKQRGLVAGGMLGALGLTMGLNLIGESLPNCPTEPPSAAALYPLIYLFRTHTLVGLSVLAALLIFSGLAWLVSEPTSEARKLAAISVGGVLAAGAMTLLSAFPPGVAH